MPRATGSVSDVGQPGEPADGDAGGEEREHRDGEPGRDRPDPVLEVLGQARAGVGPPAAWLRMTGTVKPSSTPATVAWTPDSCTSAHAQAGERQQQPPGPDPSLHERRRTRPSGEQGEPARYPTCSSSV